MAVTKLRGGVTATTRDDPSHPLNDPENWDVVDMPGGGSQAQRKPGFLTKAAPWLVGGAMGYGALSNLLGPGLGLFGGAGAGSGASAGASTGAASMASIPGWLKKIGGFVGGGDSGFGIDDLIKLLVAGGSIKDLFGLGDDEEAEWATFENESRGGRSLDPRDLLAQGLGQAEGALGDAQARAKTPVQLRSAFAQQPPVFTGGGLPMPLGVTGMDPALKDPRLLSTDLGGGNDDDDALAALNILRG